MTLPRITKFKVDRMALLSLEETKAHILQLWVDGHGQKEIGKAFRFSTPVINTVISHFISRYLPEICDERWRGDEHRYPRFHGTERKEAGKLALQRYAKRNRPSNVHVLRAK